MSHDGHPACNLPPPPLVHKHLHVPHPVPGSLGVLNCFNSTRSMVNLTFNEASQ